MSRVLLIVVLFATLFVPSYASAQNPCSDPTPSLTLNPDKIFVPIPLFNATEVDGSPSITEFQYALFAEGANPIQDQPVQGPSTMPKSAFTRVNGTPDCYLANVPAAIPTGQRLVASMKAVRAASGQIPAAVSPWSSFSNPFGGVSSVLAAPGTPILRQ